LGLPLLAERHLAKDGWARLAPWSKIDS
jgi:hypothetical protein